MSKKNRRSNRSSGAGSVVVNKTEFGPAGVDHELQQAITNLLHRIVMEEGTFTLAEIGYLHMNTLMYNQETQCIELKVYFDARFSCRKVADSAVSSNKIYPVTELSVFENYLYIGDLDDVISYEKIDGPKTNVVEDAASRASLVIKPGHKRQETIAMVINCSFPIAIAAALGISLSDPNFKIKVDPVAKGSLDAVDSIVTTASNHLIPLHLTVSCTQPPANIADPNFYDPDEAVPYMESILDKVQDAEDRRQEVVDKVEKKAKKEKERTAKIQNGFSKFS